MKKTHAHLISLLMIIVVVLANTYILYHAPQTHTIQGKIILGNQEPGQASVEVSVSYYIQVYRQGKLVATRHKENDPITINFYHLVAENLFTLFHRANDYEKIYYNDNSDGKYITMARIGFGDYIYDHVPDYSGETTDIWVPFPFIALGSGSGTPSLYDYKMFQDEQHGEVYVSMTNDQENHIYKVEAVADIKIDHDFTLTEVGYFLLTTNEGSISGSAGKEVLIAHDLVSPPVSLIKDDVVTVKYIFTIPYDPDGVFTKNFYYYIGQLLGYNGCMITYQTQNMPNVYTGTDGNKYAFISTYNYYGKILRLYFGLGDGTPEINPPYEIYDFANKFYSLDITDSSITVLKNQTSVYNLTFIWNYVPDSQKTIKEIGLYTYTRKAYYVSASGGTGDASDKYFLLLYWYLGDNAITVNPGDEVRIVIQVIIEYQ